MKVVAWTSLPKRTVVIVRCRNPALSFSELSGSSTWLCKQCQSLLINHNNKRNELSALTSKLKSKLNILHFLGSSHGQKRTASQRINNNRVQTHLSHIGVVSQPGAVMQPGTVTQPGTLTQPGTVTQPGAVMQPETVTQLGAVTYPGAVTQTPINETQTIQSRSN